MLENLQLLDLEGNDVNDLVQVQYLGRRSQLCTLTLEGNPVCMHPHPNATQFEEEKGNCYRLAVRELVPQLHYLDYMCAEEKAGPGCTNSMGEDWALLRESIKDGSCVAMAQGAGKILFCGNPVQALRARRQKMRMSISHVEGWPQILTILHSDEEKDDEGSLSIFSGEEVGGKRDGSSHWANTGSPDLPFQSPSSDVFQIKAKSLEVACISLSSESTLMPSPPQNATSDRGGWRVSELRARRLRLSGGVAEARAGTAVKPTDDHTELGPIRGDPGLRTKGSRSL
ncbi:uncharacterized protein LOC110522188 [Oncorhynchus mykiss]|nr:uncharacterized protein LOC110522188 [Oncorhynchus mykiss]